MTDLLLFEDDSASGGGLGAELWTAWAWEDGAHMAWENADLIEVDDAVAFLASHMNSILPVLPSHLAGDLFIAGRGKATADADNVSEPWTDIFKILDTDATPFAMHAIEGVAESDNGLTYPLTLTGPRHFYWHFRSAALGAQIDTDTGLTGTSVTVPALTGLSQASWVIGGFYSRNGQTDIDMRKMVPAGFTERQLQAANTANSMVIFDSNGPISDTAFAGVSAQTMTSQTGGWVGFAIEIAVA